jgi:hypothetical protein
MGCINSKIILLEVILVNSKASSALLRLPNSVAAKIEMALASPIPLKVINCVMVSFPSAFKLLSTLDKILLLNPTADSFRLPDPIKMAQLAADFGVRIHTVGVGTPEGTVLKAQGISMRVKLDESTLKKISEFTLGDYYRASSAIDLKKIYQSLSPSVRIQKHQTTELTAFFIGLGLLLFLGSVLGSLYCTGRVLETYSGQLILSNHDLVS